MPTNAKPRPTNAKPKEKPIRCTVCGQFGHLAVEHVSWRDIAILCGDLSL